MRKFATAQFARTLATLLGGVMATPDRPLADAQAERAALTRISALLEQANERSGQHAEPAAHRPEDQLVNRVIELHLSQRRTFQPAYDRLAIEALSTPGLLATEAGRHQLDQNLTQAIALVRQHLQQADAQVALGLQAVQDEPVNRAKWCCKPIILNIRCYRFCCKKVMTNLPGRRLPASPMACCCS